MTTTHNPLTDVLNDEKEFLQDVNKSTARFFENESLEVLYSDSNREIKGFRDEANMCVYVLDKKEDKIIVSIDNMHSFNKNKPLKEILYWEYKEKKGKVETDLHMPKVIVINLNKVTKNNNKKVPKTQEEFEKQLFEIAITEDEKATVKEMIINLKSFMGEQFFLNKAFVKGFVDGPNTECSTDAGTIQQYTQLLNEKGYMAKVYPDEFFINLNQTAIPKYQEMLADWKIGINGMKKACEENKHTSSNKAFGFNDSDNHVWVKKDNLIVTSQNVGFYFDIKDDENFVVYILNKEYQSVDKEIKRVETALKEGTIKALQDVVLKIEDGKITNLNYSLMYCFELDMQFSVEAMKREDIFKVEYPVDMNSYQYQKDYYANTYGLSEFQFIAQAMMTLGGGFEYDKEKGSFVDTRVKYIPNLPEAPDTRSKKVKTFNYLMPKKISHLNADWLDALKYAVEVLKKDMPKPTVFEGDNEEDALNKAIKYFSIKIDKLETNAVKPQI